MTAKSYKNSRTWYKTVIQIFVREFYEHPSVNFHLPLQLFLCLQGLWNSLKLKYATFVQSTALTILMHWLTFSQSYLFHKCLKMPRPIPANFRAFTLFYNGAINFLILLWLKYVFISLFDFYRTPIISLIRSSSVSVYR